MLQAERDAKDVGGVWLEDDGLAFAVEDQVRTDIFELDRRRRVGPGLQNYRRGRLARLTRRLSDCADWELEALRQKTARAMNTFSS